MLLSLHGLARRLETVAALCSNCATVLSPTRTPCWANISADSACVLLHRPAQRRLRIASRRWRRRAFRASAPDSGCSTSRPRRPPPLRRTLTTSSARTPPRTSSRPSVTVLIASPVARATAATPPQPIASASAPAHKRRARSSIVTFSKRHFRRTTLSGVHPNRRSRRRDPVDPLRSTCSSVSPNRIASNGVDGGPHNATTHASSVWKWLLVRIARDSPIRRRSRPHN